MLVSQREVGCTSSLLFVRRYFPCGRRLGHCCRIYLRQPEGVKGTHRLGAEEKRRRHVPAPPLICLSRNLMAAEKRQAPRPCLTHRPHLREPELNDRCSDDVAPLVHNHLLRTALLGGRGLSLALQSASLNVLLLGGAEQALEAAAHACRFRTSPLCVFCGMV